jgi:hypothetical protein
MKFVPKYTPATGQTIKFSIQYESNGRQTTAPG